MYTWLLNGMCYAVCILRHDQWELTGGNEAWSALKVGPALCQGLPPCARGRCVRSTVCIRCHLFKNPLGEWDHILPFYRWWNWGLESLSHPPTTTWLKNDKVRIQTQVWLLSPCPLYHLSWGGKALLARGGGRSKEWRCCRGLFLGSVCDGFSEVWEVGPKLVLLTPGVCRETSRLLYLWYSSVTCTSSSRNSDRANSYLLST